ncbi:hypothetical protein ACFOD4_00565 [Pseudoroseomonas globiformis]|uniref:DUF4168 domain-containing protein n=1 Tax=Teichococcus globiformis TaxID=2307229 RepID=A0ABV7FXP8_9PROT
MAPSPSRTARRGAASRIAAPCILALGASLILAPPVAAQPAQAPEVSPNQPRSQPDQAQASSPAAGNLADYAAMLLSAEQQLKTSLERSGQQPAGNQQKAMTPARMDMQAAAQNAFDTVRRAPNSFRSDSLYEDAERSIRESLAKIVQGTEPGESDGAAEAVLQQVTRLREGVQAKASAG